MLTIKHIIWDGGFETVYEAPQVRVKWRDTLNPDKRSGGIDFVAFDTPDGVSMLNHGKVYVMNEQGRTIASYNFDIVNGKPAPMPPNDGPPLSSVDAAMFASFPGFLLKEAAKEANEKAAKEVTEAMKLVNTAMTA